MNNFIKVEILDGIPSLSMEYEGLEQFKMLALSILSPQSHKIIHDVIRSMLKDKELTDEIKVIDIIEEVFSIEQAYNKETIKDKQFTYPGIFK